MTKLKMKYRISNFLLFIFIHNKIRSRQADILCGQPLRSITIGSDEHGIKIIGCQNCAAQRPLLLWQSIWQKVDAATAHERRSESGAVAMFLHGHR